MSETDESPRRRVPDRLAIYNERVKLAAGFVNATALGVLGFAVLRPATENLFSLDRSTAGWSLAAVAAHVGAHYMLGYVRKEVVDDSL